MFRVATVLGLAGCLVAVGCGASVGGGTSLAEARVACEQDPEFAAETWDTAVIMLQALHDSPAAPPQAEVMALVPGVCADFPGDEDACTACLTKIVDAIWQSAQP